LLCGVDRKAKNGSFESSSLGFLRYHSGFFVKVTLYVSLQSDEAEPYALLFTQQGIHVFLAFFATWRFIPKDQVRIYRMNFILNEPNRGKGCSTGFTQNTNPRGSKP
jgi:hypothetical protein